MLAPAEIAARALLRERAASSRGDVSWRRREMRRAYNGRLPQRALRHQLALIIGLAAAKRKWRPRAGHRRGHE